MKIDVKAIIAKRLDLKGLLVEDVMQGIIKAKLAEIVADSSNKFDDALFNMVYPELEKAAADAVQKLIDDLLAPEAPAPV